MLSTLVNVVFAVAWIALLVLLFVMAGMAIQNWWRRQ